MLHKCVVGLLQNSRYHGSAAGVFDVGFLDLLPVVSDRIPICYDFVVTSFCVCFKADVTRIAKPDNNVRLHLASASFTTNGQFLALIRYEDALVPKHFLKGLNEVFLLPHFKCGGCLSNN